VFKITFNNMSVISLRSVLLMEEIGVPRENHRPAASHWQTLSHNVVSNTWARCEFTTLVVISTDCIGSCKSNNHTITTTTIPFIHSAVTKKILITIFNQLKSKCHCPCKSVIGACIINDAGRRAAHCTQKNNKNTRFILMFWR
jgi:hypothetical protein